MGKKQVKQKGEITMETINDIVRKMRIGDLCAEDTSAARPAYINDILASYADRIEAAWKAERERVKADALVVGGMVEAMRRERRGNAAKIHDALEDAEKVLYDSSRSMYGVPPHVKDLLARIRAALSDPPRNCDLYTVGEALRKYGFPTKIKPWGEKEWLDFCEWLVSEVEAEAKGE